MMPVTHRVPCFVEVTMVGDLWLSRRRSYCQNNENTNNEGFNTSL